MPQPLKGRIAGRALDAIVAHAREVQPEECCGLLLGDDDRISEAVPTRNIADDRVRRFLIDPREHIAVRRAARERGLDVVGFYHSHPHSSAHPSPTDIAELAYPGSVMAIASLLGEAHVRFFRIADGQPSELSLVTE